MEKLTWETYVFEQANETFRYPTHVEYDFHANSYPSDHFMNSYDSYNYYMSPVLCDYYESPDHDAYTCTYRDYINAICASFEKKINDMTEQMMETMKVRIAEYSHCLDKNRETSSEIDFSLGSPKLDICLHDDFEPSYSARPDLKEKMCLPNLDQESDPLRLYQQTLHPALAHPKMSLEIS